MKQVDFFHCCSFQITSLHQCSVCGEHHDIVPLALIDKPGVEHWRTVVEVHQHSVLVVHNHTAHEARLKKLDISILKMYEICTDVVLFGKVKKWTIFL